MMHFAGELNGKYLLGIGMNRKDVERLMAGETCTMSGEEAFGIPHLMLIFGETDIDCLEKLKEQGCVNEETRVHESEEKKGRLN